MQYETNWDHEINIDDNIKYHENLLSFYIGYKMVLNRAIKKKNKAIDKKNMHKEDFVDTGLRFPLKNGDTYGIFEHTEFNLVAEVGFKRQYNKEELVGYTETLMAYSIVNIDKEGKYYLKDFRTWWNNTDEKCKLYVEPGQILGH